MLLEQQRVNPVLPEDCDMWTVTRGVISKSFPCPDSPVSADEVTALAFRLLSRNAFLLLACSRAHSCGGECLEILAESIRSCLQSHFLYNRLTPKPFWLVHPNQQDSRSFLAPSFQFSVVPQSALTSPAVRESRGSSTWDVFPGKQAGSPKHLFLLHLERSYFDVKHKLT